MRAVLIGAGQRGMIYAEHMHDKYGAVFTAVVEPNAERRAFAASRLGVGADMCFATDEELWAKGCVAESAIIASMDKQHFAQTMRALDLGYHILLEKPISPDPEECVVIARKARETGRHVAVCHVLRYNPFYSQIKQIIDSGELGRVISVRLDENIGNFHYAHSFVRGNWRRKDLSSPVIMQKSCHDMDILNWLIGRRALSLSSYGSLQYFNENSAPDGSAARCCDCKREPDCRFSAYKSYLPATGDWPAAVVCHTDDPAELKEALRTSPYGRCVYRCDNDVCDTQVVALEYEGGVTVSFNMSAMTNRMCRTIKVMCEHGEIEGNDLLQTIEVQNFASNQVEGFTSRLIRTPEVESGHGGGDGALVDDFIALLSGSGESRSSVEVSVDSHIMAWAAERSRLGEGAIDLCRYRDALGMSR